MATTCNDMEEPIRKKLEEQSECYKEYGPYVQLKFYKEKMDSPGEEFKPKPLKLVDGSGSSIFVYMGNRGTVAYPNGEVSCSDRSALFWSIMTGSSIYEKYHNEKVPILNYDYVEIDEDGRFCKYNSVESRDASKELLSYDAQQVFSEIFERRHGYELLKDLTTTTCSVEPQNGKVIAFISGDDRRRYTRIPDENDSIDDSKLISVKRTDYKLRLVSMPTGKVLWSLKYAEFEASSACGCDCCSDKFKKDVRSKWMYRSHRNVYKIRDSGNYEKLLNTNLLKLLEYEANESTVSTNQPKLPGLYLDKIFVDDKCKWNDTNTNLVNGIRLRKHISVKRIAKVNFNAASENTPDSGGNHKNLVEIYDKEVHEDFVYIAVERCLCTLEELISPETNVDDQTVKSLRIKLISKKNEYPTPGLFKLMRDVNDALAYLHGKKIMHGHLDPHNVLIYKDTDASSKFEYTAKVFVTKAGASQNSRIQASKLQAKRQKVGNSFDDGLAMDMREFGSLLFYCFSGGQKQTASTSGYLANCRLTERSTKDLKIAPDVADLICTLLSTDPAKQKRGHHHPRLWSPEDRLNYYYAVNDNLKDVNGRTSNSIFLQKINNLGNVIFGGSWKGGEKVDIRIPGSLTDPKKYIDSSVYHLLRCIRNSGIHLSDLDPNVQKLLGKKPVEFEHYYSSRLPRLLIEVRKVVQAAATDHQGIWDKFSEITKK